jgi:hypothetical protein
MSKERFDWIEFHRKLHKSKAVDPQGAEVIPGTKEVIYDFLVKAIHPKSNLVLYPTIEPIIASYHTAIGFVTALKEFFPNLEMMVGEGNIQGLRKCEVRTIHKARTTKEIDRIIAYLRTVRIDGGGLPEPTDTFFCYD